MTKEYQPIIAAKTQFLEKEAFEQINHTEIRWLGGTGFMINARGSVLMIDPLLIVKNDNGKKTCEEGLELLIDFPIDAKDVPNLDILLYTHADDDHLGRDTAKELANLKPQIFGPPLAFVRLARAGVDPEIVEICRYGDVIEHGSFRIEVIKADHPWQLQDPDRYGKPLRVEDAVGFIITTPDGVFLFPGDTRLMEDHLKLRYLDIDFLALDVSKCQYHLNILGATTLANLIDKALLTPYHYGTYFAPTIPAHCGDPEDVFVNVKNREKRERTTAPGQALKFFEKKVL